MPNGAQGAQPRGAGGGTRPTRGSALGAGRRPLRKPTSRFRGREKKGQLSRNYSTFDQTDDPWMTNGLSSTPFRCLVSVCLSTMATHTLSLPWRPVADWLAQMFVDFEPGIHYTQIQMHSCMAASPVLRLYNPVTQARELDPQGHFVRCWVPELAAVPDEWIAMPWAMPATLRHRFGLVGATDYPAPLVDFEQVHRCVKAEIAALRSSLGLQAAPGFNERPRQGARAQRTPAPEQVDAKQSAQISLF